MLCDNHGDGDYFDLKPTADRLLWELSSSQLWA